jgi:hypothetical protein
MAVVYQFRYVKPPVLPKLWVIDCRLIPNPWSPRDHATDEERIARVRCDPAFFRLVEKGVQLIAKHGECWVGCQFGRHRSVAVAEEIVRRTGAELRKV